jgi:hypothetical protein
MVTLQQFVPLSGGFAIAAGNQHHLYRTQLGQRTVQRLKSAVGLPLKEGVAAFGRSGLSDRQMELAVALQMSQELASLHLLESSGRAAPIDPLAKMSGQATARSRWPQLLQLLEQLGRKTLAAAEHASSLRDNRAGVQRKNLWDMFSPRRDLPELLIAPCALEPLRLRVGRSVRRSLAAHTLWRAARLPAGEIGSGRR